LRWLATATNSASWYAFLSGPKPPFTIKKGSIVRIDLLGERARPRWSLRNPEDALSA
jgi:hypothetical protein